MTISPYLTLNRRTEYQARLDRAARDFVSNYPRIAKKSLIEEEGWNHFALGFILQRFRYYSDMGWKP